MCSIIYLDTRYLGKLNSITEQALTLQTISVQALNDDSLDLERALEEALRLGCINVAADLVNQASLLEQTITKLYTTWKRIGSLADRLYVDTGASTPNLRSLLSCLEPLAGEVMEVNIGGSNERTIRLQISEDTR